MPNQPALKEQSQTPCPCDSGHTYAECCAPLHYGHEEAKAAVQLMRSRYAAYALGGLGEYLMRTWHSSAPEMEHLSEETLSAVEVTWTKLEVLMDREHGHKATVEFRAHFHPLGQPDKAQSLRERSRFTKEDGHWLYTKGDIIEETPTTQKVGRNAPCPCGSQRKYKHCCGA